MNGNYENTNMEMPTLANGTVPPVAPVVNQTPVMQTTPVMEQPVIQAAPVVEQPVVPPVAPVVEQSDKLEVHRSLK